MLHEITRTSMDAFEQAVDEKSVIIVYPRVQPRNVYLAYFLQDDSKNLIYLRPEKKAPTLIEFLNTVVNELSHDLNAKNLSDALASDAAPSDLATALLTDIKTESSKTDILYFDELDRVELGAPLREFITSLIENLPDNVKLVVNSRLVTHDPWIQFVREGHVAVLGTEHRSTNLLFSTEDSDKPQLEIYAFGRGHAVVDGQEITNWDGALPRNLFFFFVDNDLVTRDQIFEVFWPALNVKEATNVFHVTKRKITECISSKVVDNGNYELTRYGNGFYSPSDKVVRHYDVADFEACIDKATVTFDDAKQAELYRRAIEIYKGPFLQTINMGWVVERREKLQAQFIEALIGMGRIHKSANELDTALGFFIRALRENPNREDIHREVMSLYHQLGRTDDAIEQYYFLEGQLRVTLGVAPDKLTQQLFESISGK